ncbi:MAG: hypothetical protein Q9159_005315 [Coniocarpon cinnabarinum]
MLVVVAALIATALATFSPQQPISLAQSHERFVVDLGYQRHLGFIVNDSLVTFRNIRYAASPEKDLRFQAPQPPPVSHNRSPINASDVICPQAYPKWLVSGTNSTFTPDEIPPVDPRTSEDCLALDVLLPQSIWRHRARKSAPVLVWVPGGGFDVGYKDASGAGHGLVSRSTQYIEDGIILVSINYRLGMFGWMHGDGVANNAGLLDQRLALHWVQQYIHLFGGDASKVTVLGESAGASSIQAHLTTSDGTDDALPFRGAIIQSPYAIPSLPDPRSSVEGVLAFSNITSLDALQAVNSTDLQKVNALLIGNSQPFGTFTFGIAPDGQYVPDLPGRLFHQGRFHKKVRVMTGHNRDEGSRFVPNKVILDDHEYTSYVSSLLHLPANDMANLHNITHIQYPPVFDGSQGYINQTERNNMTYGDAYLLCNARFIDTAPFTNPVYGYEWSVPPGIHGADLAYTFYDFGDGPGLNTTVAEALQGCIISFAVNLDPNAKGLPDFPATAAAGRILNLGSGGIGIIPDGQGNPRLAERCAYWREAPYLRPSITF